MPVKIDENGNVVAQEQDGIMMPVYVDGDGSESPVNIDSLMSTMRKQRENENAATKKVAELMKATTEYQTLLEGIENPSEWVPEAKKAIDAVANFSDEQRKTKDELELMSENKIKETREAWEIKYTNLQNELSGQVEQAKQSLFDKDRQIKDMLVQGIFDRSEYIKENTTFPSDVAFHSFSRYFDVIEVDGVDGKPTLAVRAFNPKEGLGENRRELLSKINPGQYPTDDEALQMIIESHPQANVFLKATALQGSGSDNTEQTQTEGLTHSDFYK